jgi:hypothetical protein
MSCIDTLTKETDMTQSNDTPNLSRRKLLARLGLAAGAAYVAPVFMQLDAAEAATSRSKPSKPKKSRPSRPAKRSRPNQRSRRSR